MLLRALLILSMSCVVVYANAAGVLVNPWNVTEEVDVGKREEHLRMHGCTEKHEPLVRLDVWWGLCASEQSTEVSIG